MTPNGGVFLAYYNDGCCKSAAIQQDSKTICIKSLL